VLICKFRPRKSVLSRRSLLKTAAFSLCAPVITRSRLSAHTATEYSARATDLVGRSTVIDMLGLLTLDFRKMTGWERDPRSFQEADFERLKASGINVFHPAVGFVDGDIYASSLKDITGWNALISAQPDRFVRVDGLADLERVKAAGKIGIVIGQQNSEHFRTVDDVDRFYNLGQRVSQLTYYRNKIGGGSVDRRDIGLTEYGAQVVERMNKLGMVVDISHCGDRTTLDAIAASTKPVLVTHSNCRALVPNRPRCKTDEAIKQMAAKGGVLGITMVRMFVRAGGPTTMEHVLDHIDHIAKLVGVEHVGVGTDVDLDGRDRTRPVRTSDLDGVDYERKIYDLTEGLIRRKYTDQDIELILGGNFRRALAQIWAV
jgi:membrane dipeptidase